MRLLVISVAAVSYSHAIGRNIHFQLVWTTRSVFTCVISDCSIVELLCQLVSCIASETNRVCSFYILNLVNIFIPSLDPSQISFVNIILTAALYLYVPISCGLGYQLGYRRISLSEKMVYVDKNKKNAKKK